ncbi:unnamed protein product [Trichobilharzia regenti]|nr:unnamed protein product [Trichobilharzia regenti]
MFESRVQHSSHVAMITMHTNGSLRYQWIVSISGCSRLSGHRFHTSTIVPHPLLPLALSTSQYAHKVEEKLMQHHHPSSTSKACQSINFNEIILWHISSVGPLTTGYTSSLLSTNCQSNCLQHSQLNRPLHTGGGMNSSLTTNNMDISGCGNISSHGGISEIARLNFSNISNNSCLTFKHIAWFPCMVTTSATSYPVALFVASLDTTNTTNMSRNINTLGCIIQLDYDIPYSSSRMKDDDVSNLCVYFFC